MNKTKFSRIIRRPQELCEKVGIVGQGVSRNVVDRILGFREVLLSLCNIGKSWNKNAKCLLCRYEYLSGDLRSEEEFLLEHSLDEYRDEVPDFSYDQYFWDTNWSPFHSVDKSFYMTVIDGGFDVIVLGSWSPGCWWQPSVSTLKKLSARGVRIVAIWFDSCSDCFMGAINGVVDIIDLHVLAENPCFDLGPDWNRLSELQKKKFISPLFPFPKKFLDPSRVKSIDLLFLGRLGSYRGYRKEYIDYLMRNNVAGYFATGNRDQLGWDEYRDLMSSAKMVLNFSYSVDKHQLKGRAVQALYSMSLLLESQNAQIQQFFLDGEDYVSYRGKEDLLDKVKYFLENDAEREEIARNGYQKVLSYGGCEKFWRIIFG